MSINYTSLFNKELMDKMFAARQGFKEYVLQHATQGDVKSVIDVIDKYAWNEQWLMNIGDRKGTILDDAIKERNPKLVLELGKTICFLILLLRLISIIDRHI